MRSLTFLLTSAAAASLLLSVSACSDDPTGALVDVLGTNTQDAGLELDGGQLDDAASDVAVDTAAPDVSAEPDVVADATADGDAQDGEATDTDAGDAEDDAADDTSQADAGDADAPDADEPDVSEDTDVEDADATEEPAIWEPPTTADEYPFSTPGSFISALAFAPVGDGLSVDEDDSPDNQLGELLNSLSGLLEIDVDALLLENIESGLLRIGLAWVGESPVADGSRSEVHILQLEDVDRDPGTRDSYYVERESFVPGTGEPSARFPGETSGGLFRSERSTFDLTVPTGLFDLELNVQAALVQADARFDTLGVAVNGGRIAGVVPGENVFAALNGYVASPQCSCVDVTGPLFVVSAEGAARCDVPDTSACVSGDPCGTIASFCGITATLVMNSYDQDTGGGPANDGLSVNLVFEAVGTALAGLAP